MDADPCDKCGWPTRPLRTPVDDCALFGVPEHDSLNCHDCWGICDALCEGCGRPVRSGTVTAALSSSSAPTAAEQTTAVPHA